MVKTHINWMHKLFKAFLNVIYPPRCAGCQKLLSQNDLSSTPFCECCSQNLQFISSPKCTICGVPFDGKAVDHPCPECSDKKNPLSWHRSWALYEGPLRHAIIRFKFQGRVELGRDMARLLEKCVEEIPPPFPHIVTPVPLHKKRLQVRGYNQAKLLMAHLPLKGVIKAPDLLSKVFETPPQVGQPRFERLNNLKNAFAVDRRTSLKDKVVLVVDDVYTTGTTMRACAKALKRAGASRVYGISVAMRKPSDS